MWRNILKRGLVGSKKTENRLESRVVDDQTMNLESDQGSVSSIDRTNSCIMKLIMLKLYQRLLEHPSTPLCSYLCSYLKEKSI